MDPKDYLYPDNCPTIPDDPPVEKLCKGYEKLKIFTPKCPCANQVGVEKDQLLYPPSCDKPIPIIPIVPKICLGYAKEGFKTPDCPCPKQQGKNKEDMLFPPKCITPPPVEDFCVGYETEKLKPPCPCPDQSNVKIADLVYPPNCDDIPPIDTKPCKGYENHEPVLYPPKCPCEEQKDKEVLVYPPNCPDSPNPPVNTYCKGYEKLKIKSPCPCAE